MKLPAYDVEEEIGRGSFAIVYKALHVSTVNFLKNFEKGRVVAIKTVSTEKLNRKLMENLDTEISILREIDHKNIVKLLSVEKGDKQIHLVMEYCRMGDLSQYIKLHRPLSEDIARKLLLQLVSALSYLRSRNLVHRDIKPQNLLLTPGDDVPNIKLADFGFAKHMNPIKDLAETLCGSPLYMAPEILRYDKYDASADLWSVGVLSFELVTGKPPFRAQNHIQLLKKIEACEEIDFPASASFKNRAGVYKIDLSFECRDFILGLLKKDPTSRIPFEEFVRHPFLTRKGRIKIDKSRMSNAMKDYVVVDKSSVEVNTFADGQANRFVGSIPIGIHNKSDSKGNIFSLSAPSKNMFAIKSIQEKFRKSCHFEKNKRTVNSPVWYNEPCGQDGEERHILKYMASMSRRASIILRFSNERISYVCLPYGIRNLPVLTSGASQEFSPNLIDVLKEEIKENKEVFLHLQEALLLLLKALHVLQLALIFAQQYWEKSCFRITSANFGQGIQWLRTTFNESLEKSDAIRIIISDEFEPTSTCVEKILYQEAIKLVSSTTFSFQSRSAAQKELKEDFKDALDLYSEGILTLEALLLPDAQIEKLLTDEDRQIIQYFIKSLNERKNIISTKIT
ncbi:Protein kinase, catalytic domain-containing protein [Rozella allomycis CSF55]|uniref:non-specific serine/threonine protein kinase n=1 Tax=Rozella allomycis (strain CSF55) TaxID=988480 RepID=A0A075AVM6_ROZAC|nr:Protein kinase, catalytic domain-containing protein [Rozella allomycis CSF55]|eukprot:EPZ32762.1 Protein kinase, catalytic domain-containing protein [Rozella allomycis CSF55]